MPLSFRLIALPVALGALLGVQGAVQSLPGADSHKQHHFMFMQYSPGNRIVELSDDGKILWQHPIPSLAVMFKILKNGNVVYAYGGSPTGVQEVDRDHKVVWDYRANCEQVLGFDLLPNGNVLVGEQGPCRAVEVNRKGEEVRTTPLTTNEKAAHRQLRSIHKLKNGNLIGCHEGDGAVREVTPEGRIVWEYGPVDSVFDAIRLKNGNTLIAAGTQARIIEVTPAKQIVWEFGAKDAPELGLTWITGLQILKNGDIVAANFLRGNEGKGVHAFEVTRGKKVLWTFADHQMSTLVTMAKFLDEPER
jgi:hypothetical protein